MSLKSNQNVIGSPKSVQSGQGFSPVFNQHGPKSLKLDSKEKSKDSLFNQGVLMGIDGFSPRRDQKVYTEPIVRNRSNSTSSNFITNQSTKSLPLQIQSFNNLFSSGSVLSNTSNSPRVDGSFDELSPTETFFKFDFEMDGKNDFDVPLSARSDLCKLIFSQFLASAFDYEEELNEEDFEPSSFNDEIIAHMGGMDDLIESKEKLAKSLPSKEIRKGSEDLTNFVEHPLGEHPSRTLFVRNISCNVEDDELKQLFEVHGAIRNMYTQCKHRGFVMISYFDIRHAKSAMKSLQNKVIKKRKIDIHYSIPKDNPSERDLNQGTLVVFNLDSSITNDELKNIFSKYGEVKEIRETPNKKHHKFVEFYDVREADKAMKALNKIELKGKKIKIEPSRPGGTRRSNFVNYQESSSPRLSEFVESPEEKKTILSKSQTEENTERIRSRNRINSIEDRKKFQIETDRVKQGEDKRTTLMIKNIPNKYTQKMLLQTIDIKFKGSYDFLYLPIDFKNRCNVGYAFINFISPISIVGFSGDFHGKKWEKFNSEKVCELTYARIQGKNNLIEHFQNSSLMCEDTSCRPIIFHSDGPYIGKEQQFPVGPNVKYLTFKKKGTKKK